MSSSNRSIFGEPQYSSPLRRIDRTFSHRSFLWKKPSRYLRRISYLLFDGASYRKTPNVTLFKHGFTTPYLINAFQMNFHMGYLKKGLRSQYHIDLFLENDNRGCSRKIDIVSTQNLPHVV